MMDEGPSARAFGGRGLLVVRLRRRRRVWRMGRVGWRGRGGGVRAPPLEREPGIGGRRRGAGEDILGGCCGKGSMLCVG